MALHSAPPQRFSKWHKEAPMADRIFLVDGMNYAFRAYFAIRGLTTSKGEPANAVFGFARVLLRILREQDPSHIVMVFDAPGKTFREDLYPDYKGHRPETPTDLISQFPVIDELVEAFNIKVLRVPGVEADDVIGTLARRAEGEGLEAVIMSGDKDLLQLVTNKVTVYDMFKGDKGMWYDPAAVEERYGVDPARVVDVLALMGDSSDNVPGVRGIGEKTARKLLAQYETLDGLYEHVEDLKGKQKEKVEADRELAYLSRTLVTIDTDVELDTTLEDLRTPEPNNEALANLFQRLEFRNLTEEFLPDTQEEEETDYRLILTEEELTAVVGEMRAAGTFAVDTETTSTNAITANLVGISLSCKAATGYYLPLAHTPDAMMVEHDPEDLFGREPIEGLDGSTVKTLLGPLLADETVKKVGHNIKYDLIVLERAGLPLAGIAMDTMVTSYLTDPSRMRHNLSEVSLHYLKRKMIPISELIGKGSKQITFDHVPVSQACEYASEDADITWRLAEVFGPLLRERDLEALFTKVELPLIRVLARMETTGIAIDLAIFDALRQEIEERLITLEKEIHSLAGAPFQINSPKQLQEVLFTQIGLKPIRKTKTGYSTDVEVLEQLAHEHPLPEKVLAFRSLEKLRGTYVDALPKLVNPETGRIHTSYNQAVAATGRLSSSDPNLQNIPVRTDMGRRIRQGFVPGGKDQKLISADYSQIELRILAHLAQDEHLNHAFMNDADIHRDTAARVFGVDPDEVTSDMRRQAKAVNFGVLYGQSPYGLARSLGIPQHEAKGFIEAYFDQYPGVREWIDSTIAEAKDVGYVTTMLNRRRYVPELRSSDGNVRKAAERVTINTPVQGSAADIIKLAMIRLDERIGDLDGRLLLQVHDELLVEGPTERSDDLAALMREVMENAVALTVPLKVDVGIGNHWEEIH
jgi:DNA polymerase-1